MITYRIAKKEDLPQVAVTHKECFPDYFLTSFGEHLLCKYYSEYFEENNLFVLAEDNGEIIGFVMGYLSGSKARQRFESKYRLQLAWMLFVQCIGLNKMALQKAAGKVKSILEKKEKPASLVVNKLRQVNLLSICVMKQYRGSDTATRLVEEFERLLININVISYSLSVYKNNIRARRFYEKMGFRILNENEEEVNYIKKLE